MKLFQTSLQVIEFGDKPDDKYYCLINLKKSPNGMNIEKLRLTDPRNFDLQFKEAGCIMMLTGGEVEELIRRDALDEKNLHKSLFGLALKEGVIKKP
jgi:hypothetical protein